MKKILILFIMSMIIASCATTSVNRTEKYPQLTSHYVTSSCESTEFWQIRVMPMPAAVIRYNSCAGISDLLLIVTPTDGFTSKQRRLTAELALTYYVDFINREQSDNGTKKWTAKLMGQELTSSDTDGNQEVFFHVVTSTKQEKK